MKKYLFFFALIVLVVIAVGGCRLTGPTDKEVFEAMQAVMRGFQASMDQETLEINDTYANAADGVFRNDDESVVTNIAFIMMRTACKYMGIPYSLNTRIMPRITFSAVNFHTT